MKFFWPSLIVTLGTQGCIGRGTNYERIAMPDAGDPYFRAKLEALRDRMFHIVHFLQSDMVLGILSPLEI